MEIEEDISIIEEESKLYISIIIFFRKNILL